MNIVLDAVFICVFHWGTAGAAIATLLGNLVAVIFYLYLIFAKKSNISIRLSDFSGKDKIASSVYAIGITAAISTIGQSLCQIFMNTKMAVYGDIPVAGLGAACNIITIVMVFALGIAQGVQPLLGYQIGNQNKKKFNTLLKYSSILLPGVAVVLTIVCYLAMKPVISCFVSGADAINYGVTFGKILLTTGWCYCIFQFCSLLIQVMNRPIAALAVNLSKNAYVFIPVLAITSRLGGMNGVVWSMPLTDVISTIIAIPVTIYCIKKCFADGKETEALKKIASATVVERIKRVSHRDGISVEDASKKIVRVDKERSQYYNSFGSQQWGVAENYDLTLNLTSMTLENATEITIAALHNKEDFCAGGGNK